MNRQRPLLGRGLLRPAPSNRDGLSVVPRSEVVEVSGIRDALRRHVLAHLAVPRLLVRFSWQAVSRNQLHEVLLA